MTRRTIAALASVAALAAVVGADAGRPSPAPGPRLAVADGFTPPTTGSLARLEIALEAALERAEIAERERDDLAVMLAEAVETLELEQEHREQAEKALAECLAGCDR